jgi:hypothetical protein
MKRNHLALGLSILALSVAAGARADFSGYYDHSNWYLYSEGDGYVANATPSTLTLVGDNSGWGGYTDYIIAIEQDGILSFDWSYFSIDDPGFDYASYYAGGMDNFLSDASGESGSVSIAVTAGELFAFTVYSEDGWLGAGELTITNFNVEPVPEPATMAVLGLGAAALVRRRRSK